MTDRDLYPDEALYSRLWSQREAEAHEVSPSLAAIVSWEYAEALATMRGEEVPERRIPWDCDTGPAWGR